MDISLQPVFDKPGTFAIILYNNVDDIKILYKRKFKNSELAVKYGEDQLQPYFYDGFPDAKFVKLLIKKNLDQNVSIGAHVVRSSTDMLTNECVDCKLENK
jgi:selenoprotein W-related protein